MCPYCNEKLEKVPKRKSKCPHCSKYIYVREGKLVTHKDSILINSKKNVEYLGLSGVSTSKT